MVTKMEGVLMAFSFVLIFEPVVAELACVLLFHLMGPNKKKIDGS